jgi:integrase
MSTIYDLITLEFQNEHDLEHDLEHKTNFSTPAIYDANGDLNKRWYVYFSFRNPKTGKLKRMKNIYGKANRYKTKAERYSVLNLYKTRLSRFLEQGYNPFEDNTAFHRKQIEPSNTMQPKPVPVVPEPVIKPLPKKKVKSETKPKGMTIQAAFDRAIELKTNVVGEKSLSDYKSRLKGLQKYIKKNHKQIKSIKQLNKKIIVEFLNVVQLRSSARNRNNYRTVFSSIFQTLEDNEIIDNNFILNIKALKSKPTRHETYSEKQQKDIFDYIENNDPHLLLFIKFMSYSFTRPIEVCRLKIKDINLIDNTIKFKAKNSNLKTKILPEILLKELPDLSEINPEHQLFGRTEIGEKWTTTLINRRDNFTKRFKTVKDALGFKDNYTLYGFRHTFITKVYRALVAEYSPFEAKSRLMQITGHKTMAALEKYLREIDAELPEDYSSLLK